MKSLFRLKSYIRPVLGLLLISTVLAIPVAALRVGPIPLIQRFVDELVITKDASKLLVLPMILIGLFVVNFFVRFFHTYLLKLAIARIDQKLKNDLHHHLMGLSADVFSQHRSGSLISTITYDTNYVLVGIQSISALVREPTTFLFLLGYALHLNWKLTLIFLCMVPSLVWFLKASAKNFRRYIQQLAQQNGDIFSELSESFSGIRTIKAFQLEKYARRKFRKKTEIYRRIVYKIAALEEVSHPLLDLIHAIALAAVFYFGGRVILAGQMSPGDLIAFCVSFAGMAVPIRGLNEINTRLSQMDAATTRILNVFQWKPLIYDRPDARSVSNLRTSLRFENVDFAYPDEPDRPVLRSVSFEVPRGATAALVGASGAGKSSLANLIPRIFDVTGGQITWDGLDIRQMKVHDLRSRVAIVSQDVFLFHDTIEENIRCGRLTASFKEIREAAKRAHILDFIESLPLGFKTFIGERGQRLSGGERQRISIARAFLRQAPVLILDEATSNLDSTSERAIQQALDDLKQDRTTIVIAHRLSTIQAANPIVVLKEGRVAELGRHEQLLKLNGDYAQFQNDFRDSAHDSSLMN